MKVESLKVELLKVESLKVELLEVETLNQLMRLKRILTDIEKKFLEKENSDI